MENANGFQGGKAPRPWNELNLVVNTTTMVATLAALAKMFGWI